MVKVQLIRLDERHLEFATDEEKARIGNVYEAFLIENEYTRDERDKKQYAINMEKYIWILPIECYEVIESPTTESQATSTCECKNVKRVLLVEDGSVDIDQIKDDFGIDCIVYRQGANKPEWLEY